MRDVYVGGVGMSRMGKRPESSLKSLTAEAVQEALVDMDVEIDAIQLAVCGNSMGGILNGQHGIRGEVLLRPLGFGGLPIWNVENACATGANAFHLAWVAVASGLVDCALAVGVEKMNVEKEKVTAALQGAMDAEERETIQKLGNDPFMSLYAQEARSYLEEHHLDTKILAKVSQKNHRHASLNPKAQFQREYDIDEILQSRIVADPLTLLMCCPVTDGAAAMLLISQNRLSEKSHHQKVKVAASAMRSGELPTVAGRWLSYGRTAREAYAMAGIGPHDIGIVEIHEPTAYNELSALEHMGLCGPGEAARLLEDGATSLEGRLPVNPSGGSLGRGHAIGATGIAQLVELTTQLLGKAGRRQVHETKYALAEVGGGFLGNDAAATGVSILQRVD
ncbi:MAG: thiolase family protein [Firmicutes bacterium]|nr:thiolase family protein [Bacillota bacterium]